MAGSKGDKEKYPMLEFPATESLLARPLTFLVNGTEFGRIEVIDPAGLTQFHGGSHCQPATAVKLAASPGVELVNRAGKQALAGIEREEGTQRELLVWGMHQLSLGCIARCPFVYRIKSRQKALRPGVQSSNDELPAKDAGRVLDDALPLGGIEMVEKREMIAAQATSLATGGLGIGAHGENIINVSG